MMAPDPRDPNVFYAGSYGGFLSRLDRETGQQRAVNIYPNNPMGYSAIDIKERFQWTFPIVFAPTDPRVLYASSQYLWRTTNGGQSWEKISPNLTRSDPKTLQAIADRIIARISQPMPFDGQIARVSASIGIARSSDMMVPDPTQLLAIADRALYAAKHAGRGRADGLHPEGAKLVGEQVGQPARSAHEERQAVSVHGLSCCPGDPSLPGAVTSTGAWADTYAAAQRHPIR